MKKTKEVLEINRVIDLINQYIVTSKGKKLLYSPRFFNDKKSLYKEYQKVYEIQRMYALKGNFPIYSKLDLEEEINLLKNGKVFDEYKIISLRDEIKSTIDLISFYKKINEKFEYISFIFLNIKPNIDLYNKIIKTFSNDGTILDNASINLMQIRKELKNIDKRIHQTIIDLFNKHKDKISTDNYAIRNGRFVLPVSTNLKRSVQGIIQDVSDSGQTTFIEPYEIAELENDKAVLELKERDEINKILDEFRTHILFDASQLIINNNSIAELDYLLAKVKYAKEYNAIVPKITKEPKLKLLNAKHPLLDKNICVGNNFILGNDKTLMLISGPNAGGKTIALKTIGTLCYLSKLAIPLTCEEDSEIGIFNNIYVDIGDNQSIENNLSTFSSHIDNVSKILKNITSRDLVLFDELCNGTDPKEGEALSIAISNYLINKKTLSIISSHYTLLKKFGLGNPSVLNASFVFDEKRIKPTFKMLLGVSGKSYGFLIANKFGIDSKIIDDAKNIYEKNYLTKENRMLEYLEEKEREISFKEEKLKRFEQKIKKDQSELDKTKSKLNKQEERLKENKIESFDKFLDTKYCEINNIYNKFIEDKNHKKAMEKLLQINIEESKIDDISINDYVLIKNINVRGKVLEIKKNKIKVVSDDGFTINTSLENLKKMEGKAKINMKSEKDIDEVILNQQSFSHSLNLLGYHVYEAIDALKSYLYSAYNKKILTVKIIHGFGTGRLKEGITDYLKTCPIVESFSLGDSTNGGNGATIVKLKND